jgi:hypothetical protein
VGEIRQEGREIAPIEAKNCALKNKDSGQLIYLPLGGVLRSSLRRFALYFAGRCQTFIAGVPFHDVSFRAFTASPTVGKGTPTVQLFDNRSIA